jgi:CheY-like chemotaxis protein
MLSSWGCESVEAEDGESALALLREGMRRGQPFRVALVDMGLPGLDGEAMARSVRGDASIEPPLLMLLTSLGRRGDAIRAKELGYSAYLLKPVQQSHLYDALVEMVHEGGKVEVATSPIITRHSVEEKRRQRTRVLLVEDNPVNQLVAVAALRRMGYQPEVAGTGRKALELCGQHPFDIIFMDISMPDMDGFQATAEIRKLEGTDRHTPVVAVTAHAFEGDREKCLAAGMDDYLTKPIDLDSMCAMVERWTRVEEPAARETASESSPRHDPTTLGIVRSPAATPRVEPVPSLAAPVRTLNIVPPQNDDDRGPIIDQRRLDSASMGSPELRAVLIKAFLTHSRPRVEKLRQFLRQGDAQGIQFEAHAMKGMCATLGATRCAELFGRIEKLGAEQRLEPVAPLLDHAELEVGLAEDHLGPMNRAA